MTDQTPEARRPEPAAEPLALRLNDQLGPAPERAAMRPMEVEFVRGTLHLNGKPAQEWIDLADSEGTRAVKYLRRARKAEAALADALFVLGMVDKNNRVDAGEKGKAWSGRFVAEEVRRVLAGKPAPDLPTKQAEIERLRAELAKFTPLRAKGVVDADDNLDCWDTNPYEICTRHVAALNEKDPAAMWRVVDLFARDEG